MYSFFILTYLKKFGNYMLSRLMRFLQPTTTHIRTTNKQSVKKNTDTAFCSAGIL